MSRTLNVVRMQLVNTQTYVWVPLIVLGGAFVITLAVYGIIASAGASGPYYGGGAQAPLWYFAVVGAQSLTLTFPFSQAMSVTRREFYLGTLLTATMTSMTLAGVFMLGGIIERATNGWGLNGYFFYSPELWGGHPLSLGLAYFALAMLFFACGFWGATIYKRFGWVVLTTVMVALGLVLVAGLWAVGRFGSWPRVWLWIVDQGVVGLSLWGLAVVALLAVVSYLSLRRATP